MADLRNSNNSYPPLGVRGIIPNLFTLLNLFAGCLAVVFALQTNTVIFYINDQYNSSFNIPEKLSWAAICIIIAAVIDFLDGFVARLLKATSELGKQLDSLSDLVSFGVAPAVIIYQLLRFSFAREENGLDISIIWMLPAFLLACAAAYRLGKFNLDSSQQFSFRGVPVPAVGLIDRVVSAYFTFQSNRWNKFNYYQQMVFIWDDNCAELSHVKQSPDDGFKICRFYIQE